MFANLSRGGEFLQPVDEARRQMPDSRVHASRSACHTTETVVLSDIGCSLVV